MKKNFRSTYDEGGTIGKRYRRQDEIGTPFCVTIDYDGLTDQTVTVRERDGMTQERIPAEKLTAYIREKMGAWKSE
jgi:glycyl-tRNA synthetase